MNNQLTMILRRLSLYAGPALLIISAYLSFDGFDGSVNGSNPAYDTLGMVIGATFAIVVSLLQFIFSTNYKGLNNTLKFLGIVSYVYSMTTNKLGAQHILGMTEQMAWITAAFCDLSAEPMIAWGLGEAVTGDLLGNLSNMFKSAIGVEQKEQPKQEYKPPQEYKPLQEFRQQPVQLTNRSQPQQGGFQQTDLLNRLPKRK